MKPLLPALGAVALALLLTLETASSPRVVEATVTGVPGRLEARADEAVRWELFGPGGVLYPLYAGERGRRLSAPIGAEWPGGRYVLEAIGEAGLDRVALRLPNRRRVFPGVTPLALALHYGLTALYARDLLGQGMGVGVYTPAAPSRQDLGRFDALFGLPPAHLDYVGCDPADRGGVGAEVEADVDVEWLHAVAPAARIDLYCPYGGAPPDVAALGDAPALAALRGDAAFSISLEWTGITYGSIARAKAADPFLLMPIPLAHPISVFVAAGDTGRVTDAWPQDDPHVLSVGGTMWVKGRDVYWQDGRVGGGYGVSTWPRPSWQTLPGARRRTPDVSIDAADYEGVADGTLGVSAGTSFSAPVFTGLWTLVAEDYERTHHRPIGWANAALYRLAEGPYGALVFPSHGRDRYGAARYRPHTGFGPPSPAALDLLVVRGQGFFPSPLFRPSDLYRLDAGPPGRRR